MHNKSSEVGFKTRSTPGSLLLRGQITKLGFNADLSFTVLSNGPNNFPLFVLYFIVNKLDLIWSPRFSVHFTFVSLLVLEWNWQMIQSFDVGTQINHWPFWSCVKYTVFCCLHLTTSSALFTDFYNKNLVKLIY